MSAIVPGYEYDIFISYRQNDNRSGWVTEFVTALQEELATTIKEPLSIYFDQNPHDGLLEQHHVNKSLEGKLKSLIFIPILSQTYCDPKSFAWQHEFCVFNKLAQEDQFGRDIKLSTGNVASRILPIRIHEMDAEDKTLLEAEIGGALRAIDLIFKSSGVNRPLTPSDKRDENSNKTFYRDQVNKVANAVKQIVLAIRTPQPKPSIALTSPSANTNPRSINYVQLVLIAVIILIAAVFLLLKIFPKEPSDIKNQSIAVMAFVDMSPNHDQEWLSNGISEAIRSGLANTEGMKVIARTSTLYFKERNVPVQEIGKTLGIEYLLEGSVQKIEDQLKVTVQLVRTQDGHQLWSEEFESLYVDLSLIQKKVAERTIAKLRGQAYNMKVNPVERRPLHDAYVLYLKGVNEHLQFNYRVNSIESLEKAEQLLLEAISIDPSFGEAYGALADLYDTRSKVKNKSEYYRRLRDSIAIVGYQLDPQSSYTNYSRHLSFYSADTINIDSSLFYLKRAYSIEPSKALYTRSLGQLYCQLGLFNLASKFYTQTLELDPLDAEARRNYALIRAWNGDLDIAISEVSKLTLFEPNDWAIYHNLAFLYILLDDYKMVQEQINKEERITNTPCYFRVFLKSPSEMKADLHNVPPQLQSLIYSKAKMRSHHLSYLDSITQFPIPYRNLIATNMAFSLEGLDNSVIYEFIRSDPKFREIRSRVLISTEEKLKRY